ncbi:MAG: GNAT family N-acetyltransferase [Thermodesulfobacteriota bacterium]
MTFSKTDTEALAALFQAARRDPPGRFILDQTIDGPLFSLTGETSDPSVFLALAPRNRDQSARPLSAVGLVRLLAWDSQFFGFPCARLEQLLAAGDNARRRAGADEVLDQVMAWCREQGVRFIVGKVAGPDPAMVQALESHGFYLTDTQVALSRRDQPIPDSIPPRGFSFADETADPRETARAFHRLFYDGRFHHDPRLDVEKADQLWEEAIFSQLQGRSRDMILLAEDGRPVGLSVVQSGGEASNGTRAGCLFIFGLREEYRGQGLGRILLRETLRRITGKYRRLDLETSTFNLPALKLYMSHGFKWERIKLSLHAWL